MFPIVLGCLILIQSSWGSPGAFFGTKNGPNESDLQTAGRTYLPDFDVEAFNPANWFGKKKATSKSEMEKKVDELYSLTKCIITEGAENCKTTLDKIRGTFEKVKKGQKNPNKKEGTATGIPNSAQNTTEGAGETAASQTTASPSATSPNTTAATA